MYYQRITIKPDQMGGVACIRGLRIPVETILRMLADKMSWSDILDAYPDLEEKDIEEALSFTANMICEYPQTKGGFQQDYCANNL